MQILIIKESNCWELQLTQTRHWTEECLSSAPLKNWKIFMKCAQKKRCTSSIHEHSLCNVCIKMKTFGVTDYTNSRHPKSVVDGRTDRRSGPITRPANAKATQVNITYRDENSQQFSIRKICRLQPKWSKRDF